VRKIFSRTWQYREEGIQAIEQQLLNDSSIDEEDGFVQGVGVVAYTLKDKMAQVAQKAMSFLSNLLKNMSPNLGASSQGEF